MLFPTIVNKTSDKKRFFPELKALMPEIQTPCFDIFKENNIHKRCIFFSEPLIQFLWAMFINIRPDIAINHLRRMRSHPLDGEYRYQMIVKDMLEMETRFSLKIIPAEARSNEIVCEFTPEEAEADLAENGKFNLRSSQMLRLEQRKL